MSATPIRYAAHTSDRPSADDEFVDVFNDQSALEEPQPTDAIEVVMSRVSPTPDEMEGDEVRVVVERP